MIKVNLVASSLLRPSTKTEQNHLWAHYCSLEMFLASVSEAQLFHFDHIISENLLTQHIPALNSLKDSCGYYLNSEL